MSGKELRDLIKSSGMELKKVADGLGISPQSLNSRLNSKSVTVEFLHEVEALIKTPLYSDKQPESKPAPAPDVLHQLLTQQTAILDLLARGQIDVKAEVKEARSKAEKASDQVLDLRVDFIDFRDTADARLQILTIDSKDLLAKFRALRETVLEKGLDFLGQEKESRLSQFDKAYRKYQPSASVGTSGVKGKQRTSKA